MGAIDLRERGYAGSNASAPNALTPLGAGSEMRQSLGTAVFFGMLGVTIFGLLFTPAFYTFIRRLGSRTVPEPSHTPARA
jgi:hypothetical protein